MIKSPHHHILGGISGLNTPSLESRQITRKNSEEKMPEVGIEPSFLRMRKLNGRTGGETQL